MLPLQYHVLPLFKIAEYWSREIDNIRDSDELFDELLASFWLDALLVTGSGGSNKVDRLAILREVSRHRVHRGFSLIESWADRPGSEQLPSGEISIDVTHYIVLPSDDSTWSDDRVTAACGVMSTLSFDDFGDLIKPGFLAFHTTREALREFCNAMGYPVPHFWFSARDDRTWNTRREREVEAWFKEIVKGAKLKPRAAYLAEAQKKFHGMPEDAFDRIWRKIAPRNWKRPGPVVRRDKVQSKP
jgi:hypothetical protein